MTTKLKILCGEGKEKFIIDTELLEKWKEDTFGMLKQNNTEVEIFGMLSFKHIRWTTIFAIFQWIEENNIEVKMEYVPTKKLVISVG